MEIIKVISQRLYLSVIKYNIRKSKMTWKCSKWCSMKCTGELYTNLERQDLELKTEHTVIQYY